MPLKILNPDVKGQNTEHRTRPGPSPNRSQFQIQPPPARPQPHFTTVGPAAASWARKHTARSNKTFSNPSGGGREVHNLADKRQKEQKKNRGGSVRIREIDRKKNPSESR